MSKKLLTKEAVKNAIYGGCILDGGGGGWIKEVLENAKQAFSMGSPTLISVNELNNEDYVACVSLVGSPSVKEQYIDSQQLIGSVNRMKREYEHPIKALMTDENGAADTINEWLQSTVMGLPFLDVPYNGRAHLTVLMGSLNLSEVNDYLSI